ncbi:MAG TPA: helix-turn-helix transcriptional regulator [Candidatus Binataceae bacterium]|nr:helix-turn-helix transcriptional regulator [Candidatus Binataceae bacterium]
MRLFGEVIAEARRKANLTQQQLAALIKTEGGRISGPYLNDIEHRLRHPPRGFLLQHFAKVLDLDVELLYFLAHQMPFDIDFSKVSEERALAAYRVFRKMLKTTAGNNTTPLVVPRRHQLNRIA